MSLQEIISSKSDDDLRAMVSRPDEWSEDALVIAREAMSKRGLPIPEALPAAEPSGASPFFDDEKNSEQAAKNIWIFSWLFIIPSAMQVVGGIYIDEPLIVLNGGILLPLAIWMLVKKSRTASILLLLLTVVSAIFHLQTAASNPEASSKGLVIPFAYIWIAICSIYATFRYHRFTRAASSEE
jgi:hypothetical protein